MVNGASDITVRDVVISGFQQYGIGVTSPGTSSGCHNIRLFNVRVGPVGIDEIQEPWIWLALVIAGGCEMMSLTATMRGDGPSFMDAGNTRLRAKHPQSHQGVCADAIATLEGIPREPGQTLFLSFDPSHSHILKG